MTITKQDVNLDSVANKNKTEKSILSGQISPPKTIYSGYRMKFIELRIRLRILSLVLKNYSSLINMYKILKKLDQVRRSYLGESRIKKISKVDEKYFWDLYIPSFPSKSFDNFFIAEMNRIIPLQKKTNRLSNVFLAITKKCPLQCEHCFEWDVLNKKETLSLNNIHEIIQKFQKAGTSQFQITGGEPMMRINDILEVLKSSDLNSEFWLLSSGYNLTLEDARKLKKAGLTGVVISLDHFDPTLHNQFRSHKESYNWVLKAVSNALTNKLATAVSICVTKAFISESNLMQYADLAKSMGVSFIQILEPKAVGHYKGKDVALNNEQLKILDNFYWKMNFEKAYRHYPIVNYHGYYQRKLGCLAAGNRTVYVDTDGYIQACPYCQTKIENVLSTDNVESLLNLKSQGCTIYKSAKI